MGNTGSRDAAPASNMDDNVPQYERSVDEDLRGRPLRRNEGGVMHPILSSSDSDESPDLSPPTTPQRLTLDTCGGNLSRFPTEIISPSPPRSPEPSMKEKMWVLHRIKVRDFAYESTLPPVPTVKRKPVEPQIPGMPRPLKRVSEMTEHQQAMWRVTVARALRERREYVVPLGAGQEQKRTKVAHLERQPTEPVIEDTHSDYMRTMGYPNVLKDWTPSYPQELPPTRPRTPSPIRRLMNRTPPNSRRFSGSTGPVPQSQSSVAQSQSQEESQESDFDFVTPNASMNCDHVLNSSTLPESQVAPMVSYSQDPSTDISTSQMGLPESQPRSQLPFAANVISIRPLKRSRPLGWERSPSPVPTSPASVTSEVPTEIDSSPVRSFDSSPVRSFPVQPTAGSVDTFIVPPPHNVSAQTPKKSNDLTKLSPMREGLFHPTNKAPAQKALTETIDTPSPRYSLRSRVEFNGVRTAPSPASVKLPESPLVSRGTPEESSRRVRSSLGRKALPPSLPISPRRRVAAGAK